MLINISILAIWLASQWLLGNYFYIYMFRFWEKEATTTTTIVRCKSATATTLDVWIFLSPKCSYFHICYVLSLLNFTVTYWILRIPPRSNAMSYNVTKGKPILWSHPMTQIQLNDFILATCYNMPHSFREISLVDLAQSC